jgi:polyhydroxyalkanoate synthesis regulator phasin
MLNLLERSMNLGLGLFAYSREKIEAVVDELVNKGEVSRKDAQKLVSELVIKGKEQREELKKLIKDEVKESLDYVNIARKEDLLTKDDIKNIVREQLILVLDQNQKSNNQD